MIVQTESKGKSRKTLAYLTSSAHRFLSNNLKTLAGLWLSSVLVSGLNFVVTLLIVTYSNVNVYSAYAIGLAVLALAASWTDSGVAGTINVLAAQSGSQKEILQIYKGIGLRYSWRIGIPAYLLLLILLGISMFYSSILRSSIDFVPIALFAAAGFVQSRTSLYNSLLHACGDFKSYNVSQAVPAIFRLAILSGFIVLYGNLDLTALLLLSIVPGLFGYGLVRYNFQRTIRQMPSSPLVENEKEMENKVRQFLKPSLCASITSSVSYNFTLLGSSLFTAGTPIATYGVFSRLAQISAMFTNPLNLFASRKLRLIGSTTERKKKAQLFVFCGILGFAIYGIVALGIYSLLSKYIQHYSLGYHLAFAVFLLTHALGTSFVMLDAALVSRAQANHRIIGTLIWCILSILLVFVLRPTDLLTMVSIDALSILPATLYYGYVFTKTSALEEHS